jgi:hypothetical protein
LQRLASSHRVACDVTMRATKLAPTSVPGHQTLWGHHRGILTLPLESSSLSSHRWWSSTLVRVTFPWLSQGISALGHTLQPRRTESGFLCQRAPHCGTSVPCLLHHCHQAHRPLEIAATDLSFASFHAPQQSMWLSKQLPMRSWHLSMAPAHRCPPHRCGTILRASYHCKRGMCRSSVMVVWISSSFLPTDSSPTKCSMRLHCMMRVSYSSSSAGALFKPF